MRTIEEMMARRQSITNAGTPSEVTISGKVMDRIIEILRENEEDTDGIENQDVIEMRKELLGLIEAEKFTSEEVVALLDATARQAEHIDGLKESCKAFERGLINWRDECTKLRQENTILKEAAMTASQKQE